MSSIVVDLFCGGGGVSSGIELGGLHVDVAVNHDETAILMHEANHPETKHLRRSVWDVSPKAVAQGRRVRLLWASPDCTHHSRALGGKPREKGIRDLAWVVADWCGDVRPDVVMLENVPEFLDWGPLHDRSTLGMAPYDVPTHAQAKQLDRPIKERRGEIFAEFIAHLRLHGYRVEWRKLCAADYGAPTTRTRLFLIARCDGEPIVWPAPTHAKGGAGGATAVASGGGVHRLDRPGTLHLRPQEAPGRGYAAADRRRAQAVRADQRRPVPAPRHPRWTSPRHHRPGEDDHVR